MSQAIPATHTAGDSIDWAIDPGTRTPTDGWSAQLVLIGPQRFAINCVAEGAAFAAQATAAATGLWPAGNYGLRVLLSRAGERVTLELAPLEVLPDPVYAPSLLSSAAQHLADLKAAYHAHMASGMAVVAEYRIGDRMRKFKSVEELLKAIGHAERQVEAERMTKAVAAGLSPRRRFVTRM